MGVGGEPVPSGASVTSMWVGSGNSATSASQACRDLLAHLLVRLSRSLKLIATIVSATDSSQRSSVGLAEADGNRTRRNRVATVSTGFEVRGRHQRDKRFRRDRSLRAVRPGPRFALPDRG